MTTIEELKTQYPGLQYKPDNFGTLFYIDENDNEIEVEKGANVNISEFYEDRWLNYRDLLGNMQSYPATGVQYIADVFEGSYEKAFNEINV